MNNPRELRPILLAMAMAAGCGGEPGRVPRFPASGTVLVDGRPATDVQLMLHPAGRFGDIDALKPTGISGPDGSFRIGTYEKGDGAPAGRYKVTLFLPDVPPNGSNSPNDLLGGRYLDPARSTIEVTIAEGENRFEPFEVEKGAAPRPKRPSKPDTDGLGFNRPIQPGVASPMMTHLIRATLSILAILAPSATAADPALIRSAKAGPWSEGATWEGGSVPGSGSRVQVRTGHSVVYDLDSEVAIRSIHVAGTLEFARDRNTRLEVGLIKVQPGEDASENGFDCDAHGVVLGPDQPRPALLVGLPGEPIPAGRSAVIRLKHFEGLDPETCPAIISCGGRMEFHGAPIGRTWVKIAREAYRNEPIVLLKRAEVADWKPGDHLIVTGTTRQFGYKQTRTVSVAERPATEERAIKGIKPYVEGGLALLTLDRPLDFDHRAEGDYRAEVANLTRNVVIESADPDGVRGHTMYHRNSTGSISYAEFRHLGKEGVLGKYSLHFHLAGDSMRGGSVVGASIWDSKNRWITIHGTNYLVVRDCVGYKSVGHGFFLEDGTETRNVFDGNLAVMALRGKPLPDQVLGFDRNLGSGFWWANSLNTFTNNVAAECDQDGFRFDVVAGPEFNPVLPVLQPDGTRKRVDVRTIPFIRFDNNEAHCQRFFGLNLGGFNDGGVPGYSGARDSKIEDVDGVGPDPRHPFVIRNFRAWDTHWAFHGGSPSLRAEGMDLFDSQYGIWRSVMDHHEYTDLKMNRIISMGIFFPRPGRPGSEGGGLAQLKPVDDLPPSTAITSIQPIDSGNRLRVRGVTSDNGEIARVLVSGKEARPTRPNYAEWEVELDRAEADGPGIVAHAEDASGNVESMAHAIRPGSAPGPVADR